MKKYIIALVLVLFLGACQQQTDGRNIQATQNKITETVETQDAPEQQADAWVGQQNKQTEEIPESSSAGEVLILGRGGFEPEILTVKKGTAVQFLNKDSAENVIVLTFQKGNSRDFTNSDHIPAGMTYEHVFSEAGIYDYWSLAYGVKAKIIVE